MPTPEMDKLSVLIVEDEAAISIMLENAVEDSGHAVALVATDITSAVDAVTRAEFDVALLDINLGGQKSHMLPVALSARGKPFAFVTGYGTQGVLKQFLHAPVVPKPFQHQRIADVLQLLGERIGSRSA